ncbi:MAG: arsenic-transporting ATPase [Euryarchaeota archaeon]|nr:arsenic-transporting ATPase [Euryarchaeota archaeon]
MGQLWLFGGKGGVGKTTSACSTAIWTAKSGIKTLLVSSDPAHSTSDSLNFKLNNEPTPVKGIDNLWGLELDLEATLESIMPTLSSALENTSSGNFSPFMMPSEEMDEIKDEVSNINSAQLMLPGLDEALAFDRLLRYVEDTEYDLIIFDTAPTGHTIRFLSLPELLELWTNKVLKIFRAMGGIKTMLFGSKQEKKIKEELERFSKRVAHIRRIISNPEITRFTLVTIPESMAVSETIRASNQLSEFDIDINGIIINRLTPDLDHEYLISRRNIELNYVNELSEYFANKKIAKIELGNSDIHGLNSLEEMGKRLHGEQIIFPEDMGVHEISENLPINLRRSKLIIDEEDKTIIKLHLAGAIKKDLSLRGEGNQLFVGINERENVIHLPHIVDVNKTSAKFSNDVLKLEVQKPLV